MRTRTTETERRERDLREKRLLVRSMVDAMPLEEVDAWLDWITKRLASKK
jgi:hypothetical protein